MTISIHVDRCDTCGGQSVRTLDAEGWHDHCRACDGRGCTLPGWPWVKVPMVVHGGEHDGATAWYAPDPRWQPGAIVTLIDRRHLVTVGSAVIAELVPVVGITFDPHENAPDDYPTDARVDCVPGDVLARLETP